MSAGRDVWGSKQALTIPGIKPRQPCSLEQVGPQARGKDVPEAAAHEAEGSVVGKGNRGRDEREPVGARGSLCVRGEFGCHAGRLYVPAHRGNGLFFDSTLTDLVQGSETGAGAAGRSS